MGENRLHMSANAEVDIITILLLPVKDDEAVIAEAVKVWRHVYPSARCSATTKRIDANVPRINLARSSRAKTDERGRSTAVEFLRQRRKAARDLQVEKHAPMSEDMLDAGIWTESHAAEREFQHEKLQRHLLEA
eukprot:12410781-Karenia_brevis.AAC.1